MVDFFSDLIERNFRLGIYVQCILKRFNKNGLTLVSRYSFPNDNESPVRTRARLEQVQLLRQDCERSEQQRLPNAKLSRRSHRFSRLSKDRPRYCMHLCHRTEPSA